MIVGEKKKSPARKLQRPNPAYQRRAQAHSFLTWPHVGGRVGGAAGAPVASATSVTAFGPITSWQIDGEMVETVADVICGFQNHCRW